MPLTQSTSPSETATNKQNPVKVICRIKPLLNKNQNFGIHVDKKNQEIQIDQPRQETTKVFTFSKIYTDEPQSQFVKEICDPVLERAIAQKQDSLIFSYGVTNSGKTYSILGTKNQPGILPYIISQLAVNQKVLVSAIELYNEEFFCLTNKEKLLPREQNGFLNFSQCEISEEVTPETIDKKMSQFISNRTQYATKLNAKSSRSHAIFRIVAGGVVIGIVDLAGSERSKKIFVDKDETANINKSLLCLGRCIKALNEQTDKSSNTIPYRQSKLTKVLIEFFSKKADVMMIANINQDLDSLHENMKVLDYAVLAKDIRHCERELPPNATYIKSHPKKIDVFQALSKSAPRKKCIKLEEQNRRFAKALKARQLQLWLQKFKSSQQIEDLLEEQIEKNEDQFDQMILEQIKNTQYRSPIPEVPKNQESEFPSNLIRNKMKEQLKKLMQEERLANMVDQDTRITTSFKKNLQQKNKIPKSFFTTPEKEKEKKIEAKNSKSLIKKVAQAAFNNTKKVLTHSVMSLKKIMPGSKKQSQKKKQNLSLNNYSFVYEGIFLCHDLYKIEERMSDILKEKGSSEIQTPASHLCSSTEPKQLYEQGEESKQTDDSLLLDHCKTSEVSIRDGRVTIEENPDEDESKKQNQIIETSIKKSSKGEEKKDSQSKQKAKPKTKKIQRRGEQEEKVRRVAETRKMAANMCRQKSRTPLKFRLRSRKP